MRVEHPLVERLKKTYLVDWEDRRGMHRGTDIVQARYERHAARRCRRHHGWFKTRIVWVRRDRG